MILPRLEAVAYALRHRNFAVYAGGSAFSFIGFWIQKVAVGWLAWELTRSGAWVGLIAFADLFPTVIISPLAGAAVDRWDRLRAIRIMQILAVLQALVLFGLSAAGLMTIWLLLGLTVFLGVVYAFNQILQLTMAPALVPRQSLSSALALMSVLFNMARFVGPALAGALIAWSGAAAAFAANALFFVVFLVTLLRIEIVTVEARSARQGMMAELVEGLRYTVHHNGIGPVILLLLATAVGCRTVIELLPGFAGGVFETDAVGLSMLTAAVGVGAIFGGLWTGGQPDTEGLTRITTSWSLVLAVVTIAFSVVTNLWLALPMLVVLGFAMASTAIAAQTLVQAAVDGAMRGRVIGLFGLIFRGGPALGALAIGAASEVFGLGAPQFAAALIPVAVWAWAHARRKDIARHLTPPEPVSPKGQ